MINMNPTNLSKRELNIATAITVNIDKDINLL